MRRWLPVIAAIAAAARGDPPPQPPFQIFVKVESDPGRPLALASVSRANKTLATTDESGRATLSISGLEGEVTDVVVKCPEGFQSPTKPVGLRLTRLAEKNKVPEYAVACPPMVRRIVVAIRAENGPNLPVVYLNQPVTKTDAFGAAHFALEAAPGAQLMVGLDTNDRKDLKPQVPRRLFTVGPQDDLLLFDQKFDVEKKVTPTYKPNVPRALN